ncbi:hypothetical protein FB45DRAFT_1110345 [Roridomyces roridus]|uniref:Uncharacterized protein n=1 Tax=Roridomyces roridus TaxID=1738132 RepID=A0AAD7B9Z6_9AGAR|nr:hypothetical protein FB45DRAFT_1110345 [Roridomyces roridus]
MSEKRRTSPPRATKVRYRFRPIRQPAKSLRYRWFRCILVARECRVREDGDQLGNLGSGPWWDAPVDHGGRTRISSRLKAGFDESDLTLSWGQPPDVPSVVKQPPRVRGQSEEVEGNFEIHTSSGSKHKQWRTRPSASQLEIEIEFQAQGNGGRASSESSESPARKRDADAVENRRRMILGGDIAGTDSTYVPEGESESERRCDKLADRDRDTKLDARCEIALKCRDWTKNVDRVLGPRVYGACMEGHGVWANVDERKSRVQDPIRCRVLPIRCYCDERKGDASDASSKKGHGKMLELERKTDKDKRGMSMGSSDKETKKAEPEPRMKGR